MGGGCIRPRYAGVIAPTPSAHGRGWHFRDTVHRSVTELRQRRRKERPARPGADRSSPLPSRTDPAGAEGLAPAPPPRERAAGAGGLPSAPLAREGAADAAERRGP